MTRQRLFQAMYHDRLYNSKSPMIAGWNVVARKAPKFEVQILLRQIQTFDELATACRGLSPLRSPLSICYLAERCI